MTDLAKLKELKRIAETADYLLPKYRDRILERISRLEEAEKENERLTDLLEESAKLSNRLIEDLTAQRDEAVEALGQIEKVYYQEGKTAAWRASKMNGIARHAQDVVARLKGEAND